MPEEMKNAALSGECKIVPVAQLKKWHRDMDACQKVMWLRGGFDPAYCMDAQDCLKEMESVLAAPVPPAGGEQPAPEYFVAACDKFDWTPEEALRFYADGKHFDTVNGRTRILCTGAIASYALKGMGGEYAEMKGMDETCVPVLRAMARNYRNGHSWDHLDGKAVTKAADEITRLQAEVDQQRKLKMILAERVTNAEANCSVYRYERDAFQSRLAQATAIIDYQWLHTELDAIAKSDIDKFYAGSTDAEKAARAEMVRVANEPAANSDHGLLQGVVDLKDMKP